MKLRSILAGALALALSTSLALAQSGQGSSPLTPAKGGTNSAYVGFTGPTTSVKTYTLPNQSDTIATLAAAAGFTSSLSLTKSQNAYTGIIATNTNAGNSSLVGFQAVSDVANAFFNAASSTYAAIPIITGRAYFIGTGANGSAILTTSAAPIVFGINSVEAGRWSGSTPGQLVVGLAGTLAGSVGFQNATSGTITLAPPAGALGTPTLTLPAATDTLVGRATTDTLTNKTLTSPTLTTPSLGAATATSINKVAITAPATSATLTIPDGVTLTGPASSGTAMTLGNTETVTGVKTFGSAGAVGRLKVAGTTSGSTVLDASATASGTLTLPAATDTLVGKATTDTLTNKTFDTAGTGNSFSINGVAASANTGTGAVARATSPVFVTPTLGAATATSINGNVFTAGTYTLTGGASKTLTFSNSLTLAGTDATTITFQGTDTYVGRTTTDTLTNKTLTSPTLTTPSLGAATATSINKMAITAPATSSTLAVADGKTATVSNTLTLAGTDSATITFQGTDTYVGRTTTDTLTNKSLTSPVVTGTVDIQQALTLSGDISPAQLVANTNDWAPTGFSTASSIRFSTDASRNITGLAGGSDGRVIILHNIGAQNAVLINNSGSSSVGNKFLIASDITLAGDTSITLRFDSTSNAWRAITTPGSGGGGGGSVTSVTIAGAGGISATGTCTITSSGTCTVTGFVSPPQGRLTLQTATPVMTSSQTGKTTIYYTAYNGGNQIPIYDGTGFVPTVITGGEISVATTDTTKNPAAVGASKVNDWFVWNDSGTLRLSHGPDWTNDTTRSAGTALTLVNGIYLNNASITNGPAASRGTYVGTTRSDGSSQLNWSIGGSASGGVAGNLAVWNMYNRVQVSATVVDSGTSYTYTPTAIRQARGSSGNQISFVSGLAEDASFFSYTARLDTVATSGAYCLFVPALDSITAFSTLYTILLNPAAAAETLASTNAITVAPQLGYHYVAALEAGDGSRANTFAVGAKNSLGGILRM